MNKLIFTPFPTDKAGTLIGRLAYKPDIQAEKKGDGEYRGFKPDENKFAPHQKSPGVYDETKQFSILTNADDELYINAHCSKGIDYLANNEKCDAPGSVKVTIPDLILQLEAHGLPKTTKAKIKLWICEGALDNGDNKSFAQRFSIAMHTAGYTECRIFGYTKSVFGAYLPGEGGIYHKMFVKADEQRLAAVVQAVKGYTGVPVDVQLKTKKAMWDFAVKSNHNDEDAAIREILSSEMKRKLMFGDGTAPVGGRANQSRAEFKNGVIIPQAAAATAAS